MPLRLPTVFYLFVYVAGTAWSYSPRFAISEGRLIIEGEKGHGVGTLLRDPAGNLMMEVDATLSDNSTLSAKLSRSH